MSLYIRYPATGGGGGGVSSINGITGAANIVAGSGIIVTPSGQNITIASTNSGTVTSVTASAPLASSGGATPNISLTGIVPINNGGTGSATQNFVDLTTAQTVAGVKTFSSAINAGSNLINAVANPVSAQDAATKNYVDTAVSGITPGVSSIGLINSQIKAGNGAVITGTSLVLQTADATNVGLLSAGTQAIGGNKNFSNNITAANLSGTNTGDITLGAAGGTPNANGAGLTGQVLVLRPADGSNPGLITSGTQTLGGNKTFTGTISALNLAGTNNGDVTINAVGTSPNANGVSLSGQSLTLQPASATQPGVVSNVAQSFLGKKTFTSGLDAGSNIITNVTDPVSAQDAATKNYVDTHPSSVTAAVFNETQPFGTDGGSAVANTPQTRVLNTTQQSQSWASLSSNQITLAAGTYIVDAEAPAYGVGSHFAYLYNITAAAISIAGSQEYNWTGASGVTSETTKSQIKGVLTLAGSTVFEIRHVTTGAQSGIGLGVGNQSTFTTINNIYTQISIMKLA